MSFDVSADAYLRFMGRYSEPLAVQFADLAGVQPGQRDRMGGDLPGWQAPRLTQRNHPLCEHRGMIARIWRGAVRAEDVAAYAAYVQETGIAGYQRTPGNRGAWALWRVDGDRAEIVTVSMWESRSAIEGFAGQDIDQAVFYPEDDRYLIERDLTVSHYEVAGSA